MFPLQTAKRREVSNVERHYGRDRYADPATLVVRYLWRATAYHLRVRPEGGRVVIDLPTYPSLSDSRLVIEKLGDRSRVTVIEGVFQKFEKDITRLCRNKTRIV